MRYLEVGREKVNHEEVPACKLFPILCIMCILGSELLPEIDTFATRYS